MSMEKENPTVALVTDDLMLRSRLEPLILAAGATVLPVSSRAGLTALWQSGTRPQALVLDLSAQQVDTLSAIPELRERLSAVPILAFGPHTARETLSEAARLGCAAVLPRSRAVRELTTLLQGLLQNSATSS